MSQQLSNEDEEQEARELAAIFTLLGAQAASSPRARVGNVVDEEDAALHELGKRLGFDASAMRGIDVYLAARVHGGSSTPTETAAAESPIAEAQQQYSHLTRIRSRPTLGPPPGIPFPVMVKRLSDDVERSFGGTVSVSNFVSSDMQDLVSEVRGSCEDEIRSACSALMRKLSSGGKENNEEVRGGGGGGGSPSDFTFSRENSLGRQIIDLVSDSPRPTATATATAAVTATAPLLIRASSISSRLMASSNSNNSSRSGSGSSEAPSDFAFSRENSLARRVIDLVSDEDTSFTSSSLYGGTQAGVAVVPAGTEGEGGMAMSSSASFKIDPSLVQRASNYLLLIIALVPEQHVSHSLLFQLFTTGIISLVSDEAQRANLYESAIKMLTQSGTCCLVFDKCKQVAIELKDALQSFNMFERHVLTLLRDESCRASGGGSYCALESDLLHSFCSRFMSKGTFQFFLDEFVPKEFVRDFEGFVMQPYVYNDPVREIEVIFEQAVALLEKRGLVRIVAVNGANARRATADRMLLLASIASPQEMQRGKSYEMLYGQPFDLGAVNEGNLRNSSVYFVDMLHEGRMRKALERGLDETLQAMGVSLKVYDKAQINAFGAQQPHLPNPLVNTNARLLVILTGAKEAVARAKELVSSTIMDDSKVQAAMSTSLVLTQSALNAVVKVGEGGEGGVAVGMSDDSPRSSPYFPLSLSLLLPVREPTSHSSLEEFEQVLPLASSRANSNRSGSDSPWSWKGLSSLSANREGRAWPIEEEKEQEWKQSEQNLLSLDMDDVDSEDESSFYESEARTDASEKSKSLLDKVCELLSDHSSPGTLYFVIYISTNTHTHTHTHIHTRMLTHTHTTYTHTHTKCLVASCRLYTDKNGMRAWCFQLTLRRTKRGSPPTSVSTSFKREMVCHRTTL